MSNKLLEVTHLTKIFNSGGLFGRAKLAAVDDVSFSLDGRSTHYPEHCRRIGQWKNHVGTYPS